MQLMKIAWRNLKRNRVRTFIAVLAIATVVIIVVFSRGFVRGVTESSFALYIDNLYGHVRITTEEYDIRETLLPLDYPVDGFEGEGASAMIEQIRQLDSVVHVMPRIRFGAMASIDDDLIRMMGVGIDIETEQARGNLSRDIVAGRLPESGNEMLAGGGLLDDLGKEVGDRVTVVFSDAYQSFRGRTFEITGRRESGVTDLDDAFFYLPLETAQEMLWMDDEVTELLIYTSSAGAADGLHGDINAFLARHEGGEKYTAATWNTADPFVQVYDEMNDIMILVYILFILMGTVVVISTLTMIVRERTTEIGMMSALGLQGRDIMKIFVLEGTLIGLIGSFSGTIIGGLITFYYSVHGLRVEAFAEMTGEFDMLAEPVFHLVFNMENLLISFALGVAVVAASCFYPAWKAARLEAVDALHYGDE